MTGLPVVAVDPHAVRAGHLLQLDGLLIARVTTTTRVPNGRLLWWVLLGPCPLGATGAGALFVGDGDTAPCVRVADWLAEFEGGREDA
ncbi:hypothetical protein HNP84_000200 [Thermocatellispora tengchongensis]|uniref:Uncharacterized protein n=1 Tax=Thermocatellispora tengchongensis TaxID=1073253 RepID=A0A840NTD2_9ACTN|nr:hypothetical protein [Thermocatellispora tengchongensis]MBB5130512.1 hypothetical protein [Thermocatellispora tengchongensis]